MEFLDFGDRGRKGKSVGEGIGHEENMDSMLYFFHAFQRHTFQ